MVKLILNSTHWNSTSKSFIYMFPSRQVLQNKEVALIECSIYNSFFNVSAVYGNNLITFNFLGTNYNWVIPDGYYSVSDLNYWLQSQCVANKLYMIKTSTGAFVYFMEIVANPVRYKIQINAYQILSSADATTAGYTIPSGAPWSFPATSNQTPTITFVSSFGSLIGFTAGTYPTVSTATIQTLGTLTPSIAVVNSLVLRSNLISNIAFSNPPDIFASIPLSVGYGSLISLYSNAVYTDVANNYYDYIEISINDQNISKLNLLDTQIMLVIDIRDKK